MADDPLRDLLHRLTLAAPGSTDAESILGEIADGLVRGAWMMARVIATAKDIDTRAAMIVVRWSRSGGLAATSLK